MSDNELLSSQGFSIPKNRIDLSSSIIWIALGAFVIYGTRDLPYTDEFGFGPKFFPLWLGIFLVFLGIVLGVQSLLDKEKQYIDIVSKANVARMFLIVAGFFGYAFLVERAGFFFSASLLFFFLLFVVEKKGWKFSVVAAVLSYIGLWFIFNFLIDVGLPLGVMEFMHKLKF